MKKSSLILAVIFLVSVSFGVTSLSAQETQKEKDKRIQEDIDAQKKAMADQKKAEEEMKKVMKDVVIVQSKARDDAREAQRRAQDAIREYNFQFGDSNDFGKAFRGYRDLGRNWSFSNGEPFVVTPDMSLVGHMWGDDTERTTWDFSKSVKETTFSRDYTFDVEPTANTVVMAVNGDCKSGEIRIKIVMPGGKTYSDIVIDEFGNLNWRKSFNISDSENKDKTGAWKFEINSSKATGYFKISLQTY